MEISHSLVAHATTLAIRSTDSTTTTRPASYKAIGISLAVASGFFIGVSFVLKKTGLLKANVKYNEEAGEGYGYLKNFWWWSGMILMIIGEICNFVAYAFVDAILVTPLGALSVVITTILSAIFLKERLSFVGKVGCLSCIIGSVVIALNAPQQSSVSDIQEMQKYVIAPGFLSYAGVVIVGCAILALWAGPRWGKKSMFVYISICSLIGGLSVVATQGLGAAIVAQVSGESQFKHWFLYVLLAFVVVTLLTEILFLNKALNLFNAALVTPTYYVLFTSATIVTSAILFQGFHGTAMEITTVIMGFLQICVGVVLLQLSKSAKDVPDAAVFKGDLDQIREVATVEEPETEPKADSIRGASAILRQISTARRRTEEEEARRFFRDKQEDSLHPPGENEIIEWDGLRRRKTVLGQGPTMARPHTPGTPLSTKSSLPPLGMSRFPEEGEDMDRSRPSTRQSGYSFLDDIRSRASSITHPGHWQHDGHTPNTMHLTVNPVHTNKSIDTSYHGVEHDPADTSRSVSWADEPHPGGNAHLMPMPGSSQQHTAKRQFSFNTVFNKMRPGSGADSPKPPASPTRGILRRSHLSIPHGTERQALKLATEEERLGLVRGDSRVAGDEEIDLTEKLERVDSSSSGELGGPPDEPYDSRLPPYRAHESYDYGYSAQTSPTESHGSWHIPSTTRSVTAYVPDSSTRTSSRRPPNPLPPLPDEEPAGDSYELRTPTNPTGSAEGSWRRHKPDDSEDAGPKSRGAFL